MQPDPGRPNQPGNRRPHHHTAEAQGYRAQELRCLPSEDWRENDFLWGRLDGAAKLLKLIQPAISNDEIADALQAILTEEEKLGMLKKKTRGCVSRESLEASIQQLRLR
ncbi:DUF3376 domain-containing protein [Arthrobacter sp. MI7-26]|uniref:DUF3376 domain-containing protein n=1 Tax=Arthrobacter sp. MI7-26 TaxID=2993653 RepID=UPI003A5996F5